MLDSLDLSSLSPQQKAELVTLLEAKDQIRRENKIRSYFPEDGPLRRELYEKHMEFFKAGATYRERCFMAGNRVGKCITINTRVDTPYGKVPVSELLGKSTFEVLAYHDGHIVRAMAHSPFKKPGLHHCYRVQMEDGQWCEVADHHRVLTASGWQLFSRLLESGAIRPQSMLASFLSVRASGVRRLLGILQGSLRRCFQGSRLCGEQPLSEAGIFRASAPSPVCARQHSAALCSSGGLVDRYTSSCPLSCGLPSSRNGLSRFLGRFVGSSGRILSRTVQSPSCSRQGLMRRLFGLLSRLREDVLFGALSRDKALSCDIPVMMGGNRIVSCSYIGLQEVYDFTVEKYHNYIAADLVHHNTETAGGYETALHLTGEYPDWWEGRRFNRPVKAWAAGDTNETTRDILQYKLLGAPGYHGEGLIRKELINRTTPRSGIPGAVLDIYVKHVSGGESVVTLKSYEQGRKKFQGTEIDWVWLDEEPPEDVYNECVTRTMTTGGSVCVTFTPLEGLSDVVMSFLPKEYKLSA